MGCVGFSMGERCAVGADCVCGGYGVMFFEEWEECVVAMPYSACGRGNPGRCTAGGVSFMGKMAKGGKTGCIFRGKKAPKEKILGSKRKVKKSAKKVKKGVDKPEVAWYSSKVASAGSC